MLDDDDADKTHPRNLAKPGPDLGFKAFRLVESNFLSWSAELAHDPKVLEQLNLHLHVNHIREGRTSDDILYELLGEKRLRSDDTCGEEDYSRAKLSTQWLAARW